MLREQPIKQASEQLAIGKAHAIIFGVETGWESWDLVPNMDYQAYAARTCMYWADCVIVKVKMDVDQG